MEQRLPKLRGLVDAKVEQEIYAIFQHIYRYIDNKAEEIAKSGVSLSTAEIQRQVNLFAAGLATPLIEPEGATLATVGQEVDVIDVSAIPNLPAAKITSGVFPLARIPTNVLKTDDALTEDVTGAPNVNTGKVVIKDNNGNDIKVMTCA